MAGHLPIKKVGFPRLVQKSTNLEQIQKLEYYKSYKFLEHTLKRLPLNEYAMDNEHGKVDHEILAFTPKSGTCIFEIHFDKDLNINEVYLVM